MGPQAVYYIYPPGTKPSRRVRILEPLAEKPSRECAAHIVKSDEFTLRFRRSSFLPSALVVSDTGKLPISREKFDENVSQLIEDAGTCLPNDKAPLVTTRLWERMPKTFAQDLYDRYGYDVGGRKVDLQPGMRLRFEWQAFNADPDGGNPLATGYIGSGTSFAMVGRRPFGVSLESSQKAGLLTFEPFLSWMAPGNVDRAMNPQIAGALDLEGNLLWRKYYRLYLPRAGFGKSSTASGLVRSRMLLVGVNAMDDFATVDGNLANLCNKVPDDPTKPICTTVAGRTLVVPEISVYLQGSETFAPVGMTVRHIIERDRDYNEQEWNSPGHLRLLRDYKGHLTPVVLPPPEEGAFELPLVKGDRFSW